MQNRRRRLAGVVFAAMALISIASCQDGTAPTIDGSNVAGARIVLDSTSIDLPEGVTRTVEAVVVDADGKPLEGVDVTWTSADAEVATITADGRVTAVKPGTVELTASAYDADAIMKVLVRIAPMSLEYVDGNEQVGKPGAALPVPATVRVVDRRGDPVAQVPVVFIVTSGGGTTAASGTTTDANGLISAVWTLGTSGAQFMEAHARLPMHKDAMKDSVVAFTATAQATGSEPAPTPGAPVRVTDLKGSAAPGSVTLTWTAVSDGTGAGAKYAVRGGTPTITWGSSQAKASERLVAAMALGQTVSYTYTDAPADMDFQFQVVSYRGTLGEDAVLGPLSNIASVSTSASDGGGDAGGSEPAIASVTASPSSQTFTALGATQQITATARDAAGSVVSGAEFTWSSTSPSVVSVDASGRITARAAGTAAIIVASVCCGASDTVSTSVELNTPQVPIAGVAFADGFESYAAGTEVQNASGQGGGGFRWGNGNGDGAFVSSELAHSGSKSLRFRFDDPGHIWAEQRMQFMPVVRELWLEYWLYVPANFHHPDPGPSNNKFIRVFGNDPDHGAGVRNVSGGASFLPDAGGGSHVNLQWGSIDTKFTINSGASFSWIPTAQQPGTWAQVRYHAKMASARDVNDGQQQMWINGRLVAENRNIAWANPNVPGFDEGYLLGYDNSHYNEETVFYIDDFKYYRSNPGW